MRHVHLLMTRGGFACGAAAGSAEADINRVTCPACLGAHETAARSAPSRTRRAYWAAVWHILGEDRPCAEWRLYCETYPSLLAALCGALACECREEYGQLQNEAGWYVDSDALFSRPYTRAGDAATRDGWLGSYTLIPDGTAEDYHAALLDIWPELATLPDSCA